MTLGGILYTAIPFNGWYADTEVLRGERKVFCKAQYIVQQSKTDTQRLLSLSGGFMCCVCVPIV